MKFIVIVLSFLVVLLAIEVKPDEIAGFFLKVTKNVPRLGRRSGNNFEDYFRKASKSVPRIGRRSDFVESELNEESKSWYDRLLKPSKRAVSHLNYYDYNLVQPLDTNTVVELLTKDLFPTDQLKFIPWKDFDELLQDDHDLYEKIISLGKESNLQTFTDMSLKKYVPLYSDEDVNDVYYYRTIQNDKRLDHGKEAANI